MSESSFLITKDTVKSVMSQLGITEDMLMARPSANLCKLLVNNNCRGECSKYLLSELSDMAGTKDRNGACVLYRLYRTLNGESGYPLYAPIDLLLVDVEDL